jgi:FAD/FMN-containing dehydrogenase
MNPAYLEDASGFRGHADAVYKPTNEAELCSVLREASARSMPVTIAGAGTGLAGGRVPFGGWVVSLEKLRTIRTYSGYAVAGAGALLRDLHAAAVQSGQFYPPDPTETLASIGGTLATNASGSRSFRYGDTRRHVLAAQIALMDGTVLEARRGEKIDFPVGTVRQAETTKNTAGFPLRPEMDTLDLFIGSEGTLGVITEATLRLLPLPEEILAGVIFFASDEDALYAVEEWRPVKRLRMLEYFDAGSLELLRSRYAEIPANARAALLVEQELGQADEVDEWEARLERARALTEQSWFASGDNDRERFRRFRHALPELVNDTVRKRGLLKMGTDFAVPFRRNRDMMRIYRERLEREFRDQYVIFGHIGDAHVHVNLLPRSGEESERARQLIAELAAKAVELGGTVSAEHGLGKRKAHLLEIQYRPEEIESMRAVKRRFDPQGLLGRGTLFRDY